MEVKKTRDCSRALYSFDITDHTDSINVKLFMRSELFGKLQALQVGSGVLMQGDMEYDEYIPEYVFRPQSIAVAELTQREDAAPEKRVELHLHTNMSQMDGVSSAAELIGQAHKWGIPQ